jgi:hypothetical protein
MSEEELKERKKHRKEQRRSYAPADFEKVKAKPEYNTPEAILSRKIKNKIYKDTNKEKAKAIYETTT